jgi:succinoglycan biosynthesis protein ExoM
MDDGRAGRVFQSKGGSREGLGSERTLRVGLGTSRGCRTSGAFCRRVFRQIDALRKFRGCLQVTAAPSAGPQAIRRVLVAVPTFRRPAQLAQLLQQLALQDIDSSKYGLRFLVIDNDMSPTAESIVGNSRVLFRHPLDYVHIPEPGISAVRNAALKYAAGKDHLLAMIDDDEVPEPAWLAELLRVQALTNADAVIGPVPTCFPQGTPIWVKRGRLLERPRFKDCTELDFGITGNCLLALSSIESMRLEFESAFGLSGGGDTVFFRQLLARGGKIVYAANAIATEYPSLARTSLRYLVVRAFRIGNHVSLCDLRVNPTLRSMFIRLIKSFGLIGMSFCLLPVRVARLGRAGAATSLCDASRAIGMLAGLVGYRFFEYARAPEMRVNKT